MRERTAWITGARGFIGRHLARRLAQEGWRVAGLGHGLWAEADWHGAGLEAWRDGEIDGSNLDEMQETVGVPDAIFHLAGGSSVAASLAAPLEDFRRTVETTSRLLEWVRHHARSCRVVSVSSAAVYGAGTGGPIPEETARRPISPYGSHKTMMEVLCESFAQTFKLRIAIVRLFSVYGPGLEKQLVWDSCTRLAAGEALRLGGHGTEQRDWLHVNDAVRLLGMVGAWDLEGGTTLVLNGGTGRGVSVREVVGATCSAWGAAAPTFTGISRPGNPVSLIADVTRARQYGFTPEEDFEQGLAQTIAWIRERLAGRG